MRVIGVGFGRTGTSSIKLALEQLGFAPCHHMSEATRDPEHMAPWIHFANGDPVDWSEVFGDYEATVDWPGAAVWRELIDAFPDAKVLLTVRDPDKWFASGSSTIFRNLRHSTSVWESLARLVVQLNFPRFRPFGIAMRRLITDRQFGGDLVTRDNVVRVFEAHNAAVQVYVPADKLLVYEVSQGWEPLCAFLGVPVPDAPFPRVNDAESMQRRQKERLQKSIVRTAAAVGGLVVAGALVWRWVRPRS
ncbi:sulfotransferase family protein [Tenggerimyces flavus]|uniref:Sulfotransferase family protein n=1 Tax=Tenggerimyces flavus TaxID=1708749 RepID=A0ABV7Y9T1_9ACTN|nr:sulfotransferase family protein [Tenggerimyces flavus]MBM7785558.1 hypothetical protein [Tenggerimyces flavus]